MSDGNEAGNEQAHDYVQVYLAGNLAEAEFFKGMLEANDIPALIEGEASESIGLGESAFAKGVPVLAPDTMADEAAAIIADHAEGGDYDEDGGDAPDEDE